MNDRRPEATSLNSKPHPLALAIAACLGARPAALTLALGLTTALAVSPAIAARFDVTNLNDSGRGSLRQAVLDANALPGRDEILVDSYLSGAIRLTSGSIRISDSVAILGPGRDVLTVDGHDSTTNVFYIAPPGWPDWEQACRDNPDTEVNAPRVSLSGLTITRATEAAVEIRSNYDCSIHQPTITITDGAISQSGQGVSSLSNSPSDSIDNSLITDNDGAGITKYAGTLRVTNSTIRNNDTGISTGTCSRFGGGLGARLELVDSLISGNTQAGVHGSRATVTGSTITDNGSGINQRAFLGCGDLFVGDSRIADNAGPGIVILDAFIADSNQYQPVPGLAIVENTTITGNQGSGLWLDAPAFTVEIRHSTIADNVAANLPPTPPDVIPAGLVGGGIFADWSRLAFFNSIGYLTIGSLSIENTTISGNEATQGGGIYLKGFPGLTQPISLTLANTTVADNAASQGGGVAITDFTLALRNSLIADNRATDSSPDLQGQFTADFSLIENRDGAIIQEVTFGSNLFGAEPQLGPLQDNGGPTLTQALLAGSPALDRGDPTFAPPPAFDQRGSGFARVSGGRLDIGAFESQDGFSGATPTRILALGDIDGNAIPDIAVLLEDAAGGTASVFVMDARIGAQLRSLALDPAYAPLDLALVPDVNGNGAPELAILGQGADQRSRVEIRDTLTDALLKVIAYDSVLASPRLEAVADLNRNGSSELAVLGRLARTGAPTAEIRDSRGGWRLSQISFGQGFQPIDLAALAAGHGQPAPTLAMLATNTAGQPKVERRNARDGALVKNLWLPKGTTPARLATVLKVTGNGNPAFAVLRGDANGSLQAELYDAVTGALVRKIWFERLQPLDLTVLPDMNGNGKPELAVLGTNASGVVRLLIKDAVTKATLSALDF
ncbi:right-handed parallel beta-helix repeat-containing protein [Thiocystis violacea]|uniref:right-handed parallel beta-helix repeat-containing protein n=1 Tax=Thiocystis violacea TaxID=13725 RepID=UPI0019057149|nr:right-handed parallel beta-helix repeat-containing protein [Thiocystis violacea]